jgi:hypothetical protein
MTLPIAAFEVSLDSVVYHRQLSTRLITVTQTSTIATMSRWITKMFTPLGSTHANDNERKQGAALRAVQTDPLPVRHHRAFPRRLHTSLKENLSRSFSRTFASLPRSLPNYADCQLDVMEYLCHVTLLATDLPRIQSTLADFEVFVSHVEGGNFGRLHSRLELTAFYVELCGVPVTQTATDESSLSTNERSLDSLPPAEWQRFKEQFLQLKIKLLRQDANVLVPIQVFGCRGSGDAQPNDRVDLELEQHDMMQHKAVRMCEHLAIQDCLASLRTALDQIQQQRPRNIVPEVRAALKDYHDRVQEILSNVPDQLSLLHVQGNKSVLLVKLLQTIQEQIYLNPDNEYSLVNLQSNVSNFRDYR